MDTIVSNIYKTLYGAESPFIPIGAIINSNKEDFGEIAKYSNNSGNSTGPNNTTVSNNSGNSTVPKYETVSNNSGNSTGPKYETVSNNSGNSTIVPKYETVSNNSGNSTVPNNTTVSNNSGNSTGPNNTTVSKDLGSNISSSHPSDKVADTGGNSNMLFYIMIFGAIACFGFMFILILIFVMSGDSQPKRSY